MNFAEQPPSKQWAPLKYRGEPLAEVWFKPDGEAWALRFRIPRRSFQIPEVGPRLTADNLLKSVGLSTEEMESWHLEGAADPDTTGPTCEPGSPLPLPAPDVPHLHLIIRLKPRIQAVASAESPAPEIPEERWQELEARWNAILGIEASIDTLRISMESLRAEMEASSRRSLTTEEKVNALNADVAQWNKAKTRVLHALPKMREYIHRSTWAAGTPERKKLEELVTSFIRPRIPFPELDQIGEQLESLLKDRQVLSSLGVSVHQECRTIAADVQGALRTLQSSAAANAVKKRGATEGRGKSLR